ncbi:hypothetical protein AMP9_4554 [plant metagenome]|uniref:Uncharacterized protein n=1 Tax=plant metagenome TaxID=1297885 RepID=A0A484PXJ2_9ZZZZ
MSWIAAAYGSPWARTGTQAPHVARSTRVRHPEPRRHMKEGKSISRHRHAARISSRTEARGWRPSMRSFRARQGARGAEV